jgi:hypothetical protein
MYSLARVRGRSESREYSPREQNSTTLRTESIGNTWEMKSYRPFAQLAVELGGKLENDWRVSTTLLARLLGRVCLYHHLFPDKLGNFLLVRRLVFEMIIHE